MLPSRSLNKMALLAVSCVLTFVLLGSVRGHTYHLGDCPNVEPMPNFEMSKFLGKWYVIQKTSTGSRCVIYNFTNTNEPDHYQIEQISEHPVLGLASVDNNYHYSGKLSVNDPDTPAKMTVRFPLSVAGSAAYTVFSTDYDKYGAIFTCQKLAFANRLSATILSRTKTLDKIYVDKIRSKLSAAGVNPYDLSVIDHSNCEKKDGVNININDETFSPSSIGGAVKKVGQKIGEGFDKGVEGAKKLYHSISDDSKDDDSKESRREELMKPTYNADAEWLP
ncbi:unnamed protein product [Bemisia tabaci]|uniref:Apolipoprotein D n=1 Tax=Bemisia tabaci TaxID=7038 RepID=A0A9P0CCE7_BEMTA|nr:unnamed protein product [Bemisia tabaci]